MGGLKVTMRNVARFNAINCGIYVALINLFPNFMQEWMGHVATLDVNSEQAKLIQTLNSGAYVVGALMWWGCSMFSTESAIKKALQWGLGGFLLILVVLIWKGRGYMPDSGLYGKSGWILISFLVNLYAVYGAPGKRLSKNWGPGDKAYTNCLRAEYVLLFLIGAYCLAYPAIDDNVMPKNMATEFWYNMRGSVMTGYALLYVGISQLDAKSQKTALQWSSIPKHLVVYLHGNILLANYILAVDDGLNQLYGRLAFFTAFFIYSLHTVCPCSGREWRIRTHAFVFGAMGALNVFYPSLSATLLQNSNFPNATCSLIGFYQLSLAAIFWATTESDSDTQRKFLTYSAVANLIFIGMEAWTGMTHGLTAYISFVLMVGCVLDLYKESFPSLKKLGSPMKSPMKKMSSSMKRGRSKTPGRK